MIHLISLMLALAAFWLLLSGIYTPFLLALGAGSVIAALLLTRRMERADGLVVTLHSQWRVVLTYWPWLLLQIVRSALDVSGRIVRPSLPISPTLQEFAPSQKTVVGRVLHANSITLTPGTIAVEVEPQRFLVHALTRENAAALAGSDMDRRCTQLEAATMMVRKGSAG